MIVEWNAHMFSSDQSRYPFRRDARYFPPGPLPDDPLGAYLERMDALGIDGAVLVHPEPYGDDHRLVLDCLAREQVRLKGTCLFFPRDPEAERKLEQLVIREPRIVALRFHSHPYYLESFADTGVRQMWQRAGKLGLVIELHISPGYAAEVAEMLGEFPDYPVLIDHLAEPQLGTAKEYQNVLALSRFNNVYMKISGLDHFSGEPEPHLDVKPLVKRVADAFGPARLAWGKGSPSTIDVLLDHFSENERAMVKGGNLAALAGF